MYALLVASSCMMHVVSVTMPLNLSSSPFAPFALAAFSSSLMVFFMPDMSLFDKTNAPSNFHEIILKISLHIRRRGG
jgi:hypothetical protein